MLNQPRRLTYRSRPGRPLRTRTKSSIRALRRPRALTLTGLRFGVRELIDRGDFLIDYGPNNSLKSLKRVDVHISVNNNRKRIISRNRPDSDVNVNVHSCEFSGRRDRVAKENAPEKASNDAAISKVHVCRRVKLHSMATYSWAPEAFWDASRNQYAIIYSANNGTRDVIMSTRSKWSGVCGSHLAPTKLPVATAGGRVCARNGRVEVDCGSIVGARSANWPVRDHDGGCFRRRSK
jgi:hypothetical protein